MVVSIFMDRSLGEYYAEIQFIDIIPEKYFASLPQYYWIDTIKDERSYKNNYLYITIIIIYR